MSATASIFLDFNLPNATTWFYFSGLLAIALFFKFSRLLSIRNWDVLTLFLLVPGLLLVQHLLDRVAHAEAEIVEQGLGEPAFLGHGLSFRATVIPDGPKDRSGTHESELALGMLG